MVVAIQPAERKLTVKTRAGELVQFSVGGATALTQGRKKARIAFDDVQIGDSVHYTLRGSLAAVVHVGAGASPAMKKAAAKPKKKPKAEDDWDDASFRVVIDKDTSYKDRDKEEEDAVEDSPGGPSGIPPQGEGGTPGNPGEETEP
ncbi:MAG: hypothetical protein WC728_06130 [Elusimicrobiota bacterium]